MDVASGHPTQTSDPTSDAHQLCRYTQTDDGAEVGRHEGHPRLDVLQDLLPRLLELVGDLERLFDPSPFGRRELSVVGHGSRLDRDDHGGRRGQTALEAPDRAELFGVAEQPHSSQVLVRIREELFERREPRGVVVADVLVHEHDLVVDVDCEVVGLDDQTVLGRVGPSHGRFPARVGRVVGDLGHDVLEGPARPELRHRRDVLHLGQVQLEDLGLVGLFRRLHPSFRQCHRLA